MNRHGHHSSRLRAHRGIAGALLVLLALVCFPLTAQAATSATAGYNVTYGLGRKVVLQGSGLIFYRVKGSTTWQSGSLPMNLATFSMEPGGSYWLGFYTSVSSSFNTTQAISNGTKDTKTSTVVTKSWEFSRNSSAGVQFSGSASLPATVCTTTWQQNAYNGSRITHDFGDYIIDCGSATAPKWQVTDPAPLPPETKDMKEMFLQLYNGLGEATTLKMGGVDLTLQPGWNTFRYRGATDANGYPTASGIPAGLTVVTGSDGTQYVIGGISPGIEYGDPKWWNYPGASVVGNGVDGPSLVVPGGYGPGSGPLGSNSYVPLPPLPPRPPPSSEPIVVGQDPPTWFGPPSAPTPSGPISGGSGGSSSGGSSGGSSGSGGASTGGSTGGESTGNGNTVGGVTGPGEGEGAGGYYNAPGSGDVVAEGLAIGKGLQTTGEGIVSGLKARNWKWWSIAEPSIGQDTSWLDTQVTINGTSFKLINMDRDWLSWLRSLLLWAVKVMFVLAVIRLFMK
jgi:hypothetical protein